MRKFMLVLGFILYASKALAQSSPTVTPNIQLQVPAYNQSNWQVPINYDLNRLDLLLSGGISLPSASFTGNVTAAEFCVASKLCIASFSGNTTEVVTAGTLSGASGTTVCIDSNLNITTTGCASGGGGSGTVISAGLSMPSVFTVSGTPITTSGSFNVTWSSASANTVLGNCGTGSATPSYCSLTAAMVPTLNQSTTGNASTATALASAPTQCSTNNFSTGVAASGNANCSQPAFTNFSGSLASTQLPSGWNPVSLANGGTGQTTAPASYNALSPNTTEGDITFYYLSGNSRLPIGVANTVMTSNGTLPSWQFLTGSQFGSQIANVIFGNCGAGSGNPSFCSITPAMVPTLNQSTTGNAATATSLATTPTACSTGQFATGIAVNGNALCGTPAGAGNVSNSGTPTNGQIAIWTGATTLQGQSSLPASLMPAPTVSTLGGVEAVAQTANEFVQYLDTAGNLHLAQPSFSNISGFVLNSQLPFPTATLPGGVLSYTCSTGQFVNSLNTSGALLCGTPSGGGNVSTSGSPSQYQVSVFSNGTAIGGVSPSSTAGIPLVSNGASSYPSFSTVSIGGGGTGQTTQAAAFNALAPNVSEGSMIYYNSGTNKALAVGSSNQFIYSNGTDPVWGPLTGSGFGSQSQSLFLASPSSVSGNPSFRSIVITDLPGNGSTIFNGASCQLGGTCSIAFQTNGNGNSSVTGINFVTSTSNSVGLIATPSNPTGNQIKFEISGTYTGTASTASALAATPTQCSGSSFSTGIAASGNANCVGSQSQNMVYASPASGTGSPSFRLLTSGDLPSTIASNTSGNSSTATALAATPAQCPASQFSTGIAANGNANCGIPAGGVSASGTPASGQVAQWTSASQIQGTTISAILGSQAASQFFASPSGASGNLSPRSIVASDLPASITSSTSGTAATATSLAALPTSCSAGQVAAGILANGNATGCVATATNPMTALGDVIYGGTSGASTRLAGNATTVNKVLVSTGTGSASQAPVWNNKPALAVEDNCGQVCNVLPFGADPTGATSSSAAFTSTIAALPATGYDSSHRGTVLVPAGTYLISTTVLLPPAVMLRCDPGATLSISASIGFDQNAYDALGVQDTNWDEPGGVEGCNVQKSGSTSPMIAIQTGDVGGLRYEHNYFLNFSGSGDTAIQVVNKNYFTEHGRYQSNLFEQCSNSITFKVACVASTNCKNSFLYSWIDMTHLGTTYGAASNGINLVSGPDVSGTTVGALLDNSHVKIHANLDSGSGYNQAIVMVDSLSQFTNNFLDINWEDNGSDNAKAYWFYSNNGSAPNWGNFGLAGGNSYPASIGTIPMSAPPVNLVSDPGFRDGNAYWTPGSGWSVGSGGPNGLNYYYVTGTGSASTAGYLDSIAQATPKSSTLCYSLYIDASHVTSGSIIISLSDTNLSGTNYSYGSVAAGFKGSVGNACFTSTSSGLLFWSIQPNGATIASGQQLIVSAPMLSINQLEPYIDSQGSPQQGPALSNVLSVTVGNGESSTVNIGCATMILVTGPSASFQIDGFTLGSSCGPANGWPLTVLNMTTQTMTINNNDANAPTGTKIWTYTGASVPQNGDLGSSSTYVYETEYGYWRLLSHIP